MFRSKIVIAGVVAVVAALALAAVVLAQGGSPQTPALAGTWTTDVTLQNPPPGVDPTFRALDTVTATGAIVVSSSQAHPETRSLAQGVCAHDAGLAYSCTFVWFRFDGTGAFVGMQRVERTMTLATDGQSFDSADTIQVLAPNGTVVATLHGSESGHRLGS